MAVMEAQRMAQRKTYSELIQIPDFLGRYRYLKLGGRVGEATFGSRRMLNQMFYKTDEWRHVRDEIIIRDSGCDLGILDREIGGRILIHHLNPITKEDILRRDQKLFDPENLICVCKNTHDAIHYGDESLLMLVPLDRAPNDTCPWR